MVEALTLGQSGGSEQQQQQQDGPRTRLLAMGFDEARVDEALLVTDGDEAAALEVLMA